MNQATSRDRDAAGDRVQHALSAAIDQHGAALLREPEKLKALLFAAAPDALRMIGAIVTAVANQVPQAMLAAHSDEHLASILPALVDRLMAVAPLDRGQATWVVRAWAQALALSAHSLDAPSSSGVAAAPTTSTVPDRRANLAEMLGPQTRPAAARENPASAAMPEDIGASPSNVPASLPPAVVAASGATENTPIAPSPPIAAPPPEVVTGPAAIPLPPVVSTRDRGEATAPPSVPTKPRSRRPLAMVMAIAVIVVIGVGGWRWMASRPAAVASAAIASAPMTSYPATATSSPPASTISPPPPTPAPPTVPASAEVAPPAKPELPTVVGDAPTPSPSSPAPSNSLSRPPPSVRASPSAVPSVPSAAASVPAPAPIASPSGDRAGASACTRASCGSVVSVRTLHDDGPTSQAATTRGYEMTIRMDDRSIQTLTQAQPLRAGSRVRMVGNGFVPTSE